MLVVVISAVASGLLAAIGADVLNPRTNAPTVALIFIIGLSAVGQSTEGAINKYRQVRLDRLREAVRHPLIAALVSLDELPGLSFRTTSISVLLVRRRLRPPFHQFMFTFERLRMFPVPPSVGILWTKGKGIVGQCWADNNVAAGETGALWERWIGCTKAEWKKAPEEVRLRFRYKEFKAIAGKYEAVLAVPIVVKDRFQGCVAVDGRRHHVAARDLLDARVADVAQNAALSIGNLLALDNRLER